MEELIWPTTLRNLHFRRKKLSERRGKKLVFIFLDQEAYCDRSYYYCEEDDTVYSEYLSIGD